MPLAMEATRFQKGVLEIQSETRGGSFSRATYAFVGTRAYGHPDATLPVHEAIAEYLRNEESQYQLDCKPAEKFSNKTVISKVGETFLVQMIVDCTDLAPSDLTAICRRAEALSELFEGAFQVGHVLRRLPKLKIRDVMGRFLMARRLACGSPLSTKINGGVDSVGGLVWRAVAACPHTFGEHGRLAKLKLRCGAVVDVDAVYTLGNGYVWSDGKLCIPNDAKADVKLKLYFKKSSATGPRKRGVALEEDLPRSETYEEVVTVAFCSWRDNELKVQAAGVVEDAVKEVKAARDGATSERKRRVLAEAREKGKAALKQRLESQ